MRQVAETVFVFGGGISSWVYGIVTILDAHKHGIKALWAREEVTAEEIEADMSD